MAAAAVDVEGPLPEAEARDQEDAAVGEATLEALSPRQTNNRSRKHPGLLMNHRLGARQRQRRVKTRWSKGLQQIHPPQLLPLSQLQRMTTKMKGCVVFVQSPPGCIR